jgi:hypothetical protein
VVSRPLDLREAGRIAADLLLHPWIPQTAAELDAALNHHDRILDALAASIRSGARIWRPRNHRLSTKEVGENLPRALLGALEMFPRWAPAPDLAPTELLTENNPAGGLWKELNRVLLIVAHDWSMVTDRVPDLVQWGLVADIAALSGAVAILQEDLLSAALSQGRSEPMVRSMRVAAAALSVCAHTTLEFAVAGPTQDGWIPGPGPPTHVVLPRDTDGIVQAADMLARMLKDNRLRLSASGALQLITTHAMTSAAAGRFLESNGREEVGRALLEHAEHLAAGVRAVRHRLWSPSQRAHQYPLFQARELHWGVERELRPGMSSPNLVQAADAYTAKTLSITEGLSKLVTASIKRGDWAVLDTESASKRLPWKADRWSTTKTAAVIADALREAARAVKPFGSAADVPDMISTNSPETAHQVLRPVISGLFRPRVPSIGVSPYRRSPPPPQPPPGHTPRPPPGR